MARSTTGLFLAAALLLCSKAGSADVVFSDSTFNLLNYSESPQFSSGTISTFQQCANCGNPGTALQINNSFATGTGAFALAFINNGFTYIPTTQGAILSISASVDKNEGINFAATGLGNTFRPTIEQDGNFYLAAIPGPTLTTGATGGATGYNTISQSGLTAANFQKYDFTTGSFVAGTPNFAGDPIFLGLTQITTLSGAPAGATFFADYDNLVLRVATAVPEPSALVLLGTLVSFLGAIGMARRSWSD
jgi:hypothetical protein